MTTTELSNTTTVQDSAWISQAADGDVMVIMGGASLRESVPVGIDLARTGRIVATQDGRTLLDAELDQIGRDMVAEAPKVVLLEVYQGATSDQDRFVIHENVTVNQD